MAKLIDARSVVFVGLGENGNDRPGVNQDPAVQEPPKPSKYLGLVLKSRSVLLTEPINPVFFA